VFNKYSLFDSFFDCLIDWLVDWINRSQVFFLSAEDMREILSGEVRGASNASNKEA